MTETDSQWMYNYGFILVAFAHMTDWKLADSEIEVIQEKMAFMFSKSRQPYADEEVAQVVVNIINTYHTLRGADESAMMSALINSCNFLKSEAWFDELSASVLLQFLAEIAEADHKIEETERQFLKNIADIFGIKPPKI